MTYVIEKAPRLQPRRKGRKRGQTKYPFNEMNVAQMFFIPFSDKGVKQTLALVYQRNRVEKALQSGKIFKCQDHKKTLEDGSVINGSAIIRVK